MSTAASDPWLLAKPEEIISKLPTNWQNNLESKNWQERKEVLEKVQKLVSTFVRLKPCDYGAIVDALISIVKKDVNVVVVQLAAKTITGFAGGLRTGFAPYAHACLDALLERSKEKKQTLTTTFREALDAVFVATSLETMAEHVLPFLSNKTPTVRLETAAFLDRCFYSTRGHGLFGNEKVLVLYAPPLFVLVGDQVGDVREAAFETLGCLHAFAGEKAVEPLLLNIEQIRLAKIHEVSQKRAAKASPPSTPISPTAIVTVNEVVPVRSAPERKVSESRKVSTSEQTPRVDLRRKLTDELMEQLDDKTSHKARKEAIDQVLEIVKEAKFIQPNLGALPSILVKRLKEANKVLVQSALTVCEQLAISMGKKAVEHIAMLGSAILFCFGDNKPQIRQQAIGCINIWLDQFGGNLTPFLESMLVSTALRTGNPILRAEFLAWLAKRLPPNSARLPKDDLIESIPFLLSALEDRSGEVRKAGQDALLPFMIHTGYEPFAIEVETSLKPASKDQLSPIIDKARQQLVSAPVVHQLFQPEPPKQQTVVVKKSAIANPAAVKHLAAPTSPAKTQPLVMTSKKPIVRPRTVTNKRISNNSPVAPVQIIKQSTVKTVPTRTTVPPSPVPATSSKTSLVYTAQQQQNAVDCGILSNIIEVKAKLNQEVNVDRIVKQACVLTKTAAKTANVAVFEQRDTFFNCVLPGKRLKLREEIQNSQTKKTFLIGYGRFDEIWPVQCSDYSTSQIDLLETEQIKSILTKSFGVRGQIIKTRTVISISGRQTRILVDQVRGLGNFVKIEVDLRKDQTPEDGLKQAEDILRILNISLSNLIAPSYIDLQLEKAYNNS